MFASTTELGKPEGNDEKIALQEKSLNPSNNDGCNIPPSELQQTDSHTINSSGRQKLHVLHDIKLNIPIAQLLFQEREETWILNQQLSLPQNIEHT